MIDSKRRRNSESVQWTQKSIADVELQCDGVVGMLQRALQVREAQLRADLRQSGCEPLAAVGMRQPSRWRMRRALRVAA